MIRSSLLCAPLLLLAAACAEEEEPAADSSAAAGLPERYWLAEAPDAPASVLEAREAAGDGGPVAVVGRVSGLVDGRAQFRLTDRSLTPCNERPGDSCQTPWDYCCEAPDTLSEATLVVEVHEDGRLARTSLAGFHGLELLDEVVVEGTATKDDAGNVTVVATGIHVPGA